MKNVLTPGTISELIGAAISVRENAYAPYSHFAVGCALLAADVEEGKERIFCGCNLENGAFSPSLCAERGAIASAVSKGVRKFLACAVVGGKEGEKPNVYCPPCGVCRQVLAEFCSPDMPVILATSEADFRIVFLSELFPFAFRL